VRGLRHFLGVTYALCIAVLGGAVLTALALDHGDRLSRRDVGVWHFWPEAGSPAADPYLRAVTARQALLPVALGEGIGLTARQDQDGAPLAGSCDYRIEGRAPSARVLTLSVYGLDGQPLVTPARRFAFAEDELLRDERGDFAIALSAEPKAGNWLPLEAGAPFVIMLRLYDTPLGANAAALTEASVPRIIRGACR
jgi:hypothetical protein